MLTIGFTETLYTVTENNGSLVIVTAALLSGITVEEIVVKVAVPQYNSAGTVCLHVDVQNKTWLYRLFISRVFFNNCSKMHHPIHLIFCIVTSVDVV